MKHTIFTRHSIGLTLLAACCAPLNAETNSTPRNVDGIRDNSFLVEEAYNQEAGVVQHIFTMSHDVDKQRGDDDKAWNFSFTQEWPAPSLQHQLSFTLPYSLVESGGSSENGIGDVLLNYRYQAYFDETTLCAFAPRLSLILPTGDADRGFGDDTVGGQINLPFSTAMGDFWFAHLNVGATFLPDAASANDRDIWNFNLGASAIYAATPDLHFLLECIANWDEAGDVNGTEREFSSVVLPGVRKAFNFSGGSQAVVGLGAPIGLTASAPDYGVFVYFSFEHRFRKSN